MKTTRGTAEGIPYDRWDPVPEGPLEFVKSIVIGRVIVLPDKYNC